MITQRLPAKIKNEKMSNKSRYFSEHDSLNEQERKTRLFLKQKFESQFRQEWEKKLAAFVLQNLSQALKKRTLSILRVTSIAASIAFLLFAAFYLLDFGAQKDPLTLAEAMVNEQLFEHPGNTKSLQNVAELRSTAEDAYNQKQYRKAIQAWQQIISENGASAEDRFYLGLAYLYNQQYGNAIQELENKPSAETDQFIQERQWFLALAFILNQQNEKAKTILNQIQVQDWKYQEAQELLKSL